MSSTAVAAECVMRSGIWWNSQLALIATVLISHLCLSPLASLTRQTEHLLLFPLDTSHHPLLLLPSSTVYQVYHWIFIVQENSLILLFAAETFDAAKFLDTHPDLVDRVYNRPRMDSLKSQTIQTLDDDTLAVSYVRTILSE